LYTERNTAAGFGVPQVDTKPGLVKT